MFNIFGNFFFGRAAAVAPATSNDNNNEQERNEQPPLLTQTSNTDACTQTTAVVADEQLLMVSQTQASGHDEDIQKQWVIVERARIAGEQHQVATSTTHLDDVKEEDEDEQPAASTPEPVEMAPVQEEDEDDDVLLGSFFDRNQFDDQPTTVPAATPAAPAKDEWLITPLPCLTSITCSQRSLVDNDPLENLLIEHPSMSVFVTVTSSALADESIESKPVLKLATYSENVRGKEIEASLSTAVVAAPGGQKKRKGMEPAAAGSPSSQQPSPTSTMRRKASKRNKKSSSSGSAAPSPVSPVSASSSPAAAPATAAPATGANKENMQVRTLLTSEFRSKTNPASKLDSILLSKNQMKRNNKHASKFNSNNCIQRKFHKLQQPVCC